jgi:hypothetical protein
MESLRSTHYPSACPEPVLANYRFGSSEKIERKRVRVAPDGLAGHLVGFCPRAFPTHSVLRDDGRALLVRTCAKQVAADRMPPAAVDVKPEGIVAEIVPCTVMKTFPV